MELTLETIASKPRNFTCCKHCNTLNYYENEVCWNCYVGDLTERGVDEVHNWINQQYSFYKELNYTENEIDLIEFKVE